MRASLRVQTPSHDVWLLENAYGSETGHVSTVPYLGDPWRCLEETEMEKGGGVDQHQKSQPENSLEKEAKKVAEVEGQNEENSNECTHLDPLQQAGHSKRMCGRDEEA